MRTLTLLIAALLSILLFSCSENPMNSGSDIPETLVEVTASVNYVGNIMNVYEYKTLSFIPVQNKLLDIWVYEYNEYRLLHPNEYGFTGLNLMSLDGVIESEIVYFNNDINTKIFYDKKY